MKSIALFRLLPLALLGAVTLAAADYNANATFADPSKPGRLRVRIANGELRIKGADVDQVSVRTDAREGGTKEVRKDGLRVISSSTSYTLEQHDNTIELTYGTHAWSQPADFDITVPRNTNLDLEVSLGGEIDVTDVGGDVTIKNLNGEIALHNLSGGAIVESMNGEISATFAALVADHPISFTSMNGEITVRLPAEARANVRFRSQNGSILTDFDDKALVTTTTSGRAFAPGMEEEFAEAAREIAQQAADIAREVAEEVRVAVSEARQNVKVDVRSGDAVEAPRAPAAPKAPRPPRAPSIPPMAGGKVISGTLNGGGVDLQIATMNGDIIVRKNN